MIYGIDISSYQQGIDLHRARAEGIEFVIAKVTEGTSYRNPAWASQRDGARAAGMLVAGYHYLGAGNPDQQAARCKAWLGDPSIPIMLDWERNGGDGRNLRAVLGSFRAAGLRVVLGYLPRWYWQEVGSPDLSGLGLALVSSRYPTTCEGTPDHIYRTGVTGATWAGYAGLTPAILQFSDRATVAGCTPVDVNAFLGSRDELAALFGTTPPAPTPTSAARVPATSKEDDLMMNLDFYIQTDGRFRATAVCEAGSSSEVVARAWVVFGITWGSADCTISFLGDNGLVMAPPTGQIRGQVDNNRRLVADVPDGAVLVTVEGQLTVGAVPTAAVITQAR